MKYIKYFRKMCRHLKKITLRWICKGLLPQNCFILEIFQFTRAFLLRLNYKHNWETVIKMSVGDWSGFCTSFMENNWYFPFNDWFLLEEIFAVPNKPWIPLVPTSVNNNNEIGRFHDYCLSCWKGRRNTLKLSFFY